MAISSVPAPGGLVVEAKLEAGFCRRATYRPLALASANTVSAFISRRVQRTEVRLPSKRRANDGLPSKSLHPLEANRPGPTLCPGDCHAAVPSPSLATTSIAAIVFPSDRLQTTDALAEQRGRSLPAERRTPSLKLHEARRRDEPRFP